MDERRTGDNALRPEEVEEIAAGLTARAQRLREEMATAEDAEALLRADCDLDTAGAGASNAKARRLRTRGEEARNLLGRTLGALDRLREGTFGLCTGCGRPVGPPCEGRPARRAVHHLRHPYERRHVVDDAPPTAPATHETATRVSAAGGRAPVRCPHREVIARAGREHPPATDHREQAGP